MRSFTVILNGKTYEAEIEETTPGVNTKRFSGGPRTPASAAPQRAIGTPQATPASAPFTEPAKTVPSSGGTTMTSPLPGTVLRLNCNEGSKVLKGDTVLVLEAMKMENEVMAPCDGTVSIKVASGVSVNTGDVLFIIQ